MNKQPTTTNEQKPSQFEIAYRTLKTDERYANMAKSCGVKPEYVEAQTVVESSKQENG